MANPLKKLNLKPTGFQLMHDIAIDASPAAVWKALFDFTAWFRFSEVPHFAMKVEPRIGAVFSAKTVNGKVEMYNGVVAHIEREKLLRINGPMGMTHLPMMNVLIWELQPTKGGKGTNLRFCQRTYGLLTADVKKNFENGWKILLPQLKELAEKRKLK